MLTLYSNSLNKKIALDPKIKELFLEKAEEALKLCLKRCENITEEERHFYTTEVPDVINKEGMAWGGYTSTCDAAEKWHSLNDFIQYWESALKDNGGLFFQILRGKANTYILPLLPEEYREELRFHPRIKTKAYLM